MHLLHRALLALDHRPLSQLFLLSLALLATLASAPVLSPEQSSHLGVGLPLLPLFLFLDVVQALTLLSSAILPVSLLPACVPFPS